MNRVAPRKYLPAEGYRFLALLFLADRADRGASKGELAWETRANHYMATRLLRELAGERFIAVDGDAERGFRIRITPEGRAFLEENRGYLVRTFGDPLRGHFRFGRHPAWAASIGR